MFYEKSLSETSIFKYTELMSNSGKINNIIKNILDEKQGAVFIDADKLEDVFYKIRHKSFNFQAKFAVLDLFHKGIIRLVYNKSVKLTVAIPFFKFKMENGGFGVVVNISNYAKIDNDGTVSIDPSTLYCLMLSAAYSLCDKSILRYNGIPELYGDLFTSVIARSVNLNLTNRDKIKFVMTKFMYMQLGVSEDRASDAAQKSIKNIDKYGLEQLDLAFPAAVFKDLETLIEHMRKTLPEFESLTFGIIFEKWMRAFGEASAFAIEYVPAFVTMFNALIINSNALVNIKAVEKDANRHSSKLVMLFNRIEGTVMDMAQNKK